MLQSLVREESRLATMSRPHDWEVLAPLPAIDIALAPVSNPSTGFRPNVVVNSFPYSGSMEKLSTMVLTYAHTLLDSVFFIAVERLSNKRAEGRIIEYTHSAGRTTVHCRVIVLKTADQAVLVTSSCASAELSAYDGVLELICSSVELRENT